MMNANGIHVWALFLALFISLEGINASEQCEKRATEVCPEMKIKLTFPESEEELNIFCPEVIGRLECLRDHDKMCFEEGRAVFTSEQYAALGELIGDICNTNSLLHKILSESLVCLKSTLTHLNETCFQPQVLLREAYTRYKKSVGESAESDSLEEYQLYRCLSEVQWISCMLSEVSNSCGVTTKSAVREVIMRSRFIQEQECAKELVPNVQHLVDVLELASEQRSQMNELLDIYVAWDNK